MKKKLIYLLTAIILPCVLLFSACDPTSILLPSDTPFERVQISTSELAENSTSSPNQSQNQPSNEEIVEPVYDIDFYKIYTSAVESGEFSGSYLDFIAEYFGVESENSTAIQYATNIGLLSTVSVYCGFTITDNSNGFPLTTTTYSTGAGVIYRINKNTGSAYIITNYHVVFNAYSTTETKISDNIQIFLYGGEYSEYAIPANYVGGSMTYDIAVLEVAQNSRLKTSYARSVDFADSDEIAVGTTAIAIGNPKSEGISATTGIVSVASETIDIRAVDNSSDISMRVMRIDSAVNSGNSGGGLFNAEGKLIGIVNAKVSDTTIENISYAIPSNIVKNVAQNIIDNCVGTENRQVIKCMLGVGLSITNSKAVYDTQTKTVKIVEDVIISSITQGGIVDGVLQNGMLIKSIERNGVVVKADRVHKIVDFMLKCRVGDVILITVSHEGQTQSHTFILNESCATKIV